MKPIYSLGLLALALAGCAGASRNEAPAAAATSTGLAPQAQRITDGTIRADRETLEAVQQRLRKLNESGVPQGHYALSKAQCWLDTARTQYLENDRTGYVEESLAESMRIAQALEGDRQTRIGRETPLVARSTRLREDLWARLEAHKANAATLACSARTVACAEVRLVRAGHADEQTGWRQATPHVAMAEDALIRADAEARACVPPPVVAPPVVAPVVAAPVAPAAPPAPVAAPVRQTVTIPAHALFRFNKSGKGDLLPGGVETLQTLATQLKGYASIESIRITGHTDRIGSDAYNDHLSLERARTVWAHLDALGVKARKVETAGAGRHQPVTTTCAATLPRARLVDCLQPDRRVTLDILATPR